MKIPDRYPAYSEEYASWFIPLTQGVICLVDADIAERFGKTKWYARLNNGKRWYAFRSESFDGRPQWFAMHREILPVETGMVVDHIKHHPVELKLIDNRRANLRVCSAEENSRNRRKVSPTSIPFKGVRWTGRSWQFSVVINGQRQYVGGFASAEEAALAYDKAAQELHGQFSATNQSLGLL